MVSGPNKFWTRNLIPGISQYHSPHLPRISKCYRYQNYCYLGFKLPSAHLRQANSLKSDVKIIFQHLNKEGPHIYKGIWHIDFVSFTFLIQQSLIKIIREQEWIVHTKPTTIRDRKFLPKHQGGVSVVIFLPDILIVIPGIIIMARISFLRTPSYDQLAASVRPSCNQTTCAVILTFKFFQFPAQAVTLYISSSNPSLLIFGSDRSPRNQDVRTSVCAWHYAHKHSRGVP